MTDQSLVWHAAVAYICIHYLYLHAQAAAQEPEEEEEKEEKSPPEAEAGKAAGDSSKEATPAADSSSGAAKAEGTTPAAPDFATPGSAAAQTAAGMHTHFIIPVIFLSILLMYHDYTLILLLCLSASLQACIRAACIALADPCNNAHRLIDLNIGLFGA